MKSTIKFAFTQTKNKPTLHLLQLKFVNPQYPTFLVFFFFCFFKLGFSEVYAQSNPLDSISHTTAFQITHPEEGEVTLEDIRENQLFRENAVREHNALIFTVIVCFLLAIALMFIGQLYRQKRLENKKLQAEIDEYQATSGKKIRYLEQAHDQLIIEHAVLEERYANQEEQLKQAKDEAEIAQIEFERFLSNSSYYFTGPLSSLKGLIQVAHLVKSSEKLYQLNELFDKMDITLNLIDGLIQKLLMLERIKSRKLAVQRVNFERLLNELKKHFTKQIAVTQIDYSYKIDTSQTVMFSEAILRIILENLIENSIQFSSRQHHPYVFIHIETNDDELCLKVSDNGAGIPTTYINRIFNMYYRASELSKGCGLGLYVVRAAVDKFKGSIDVESTSGKFTEFTIRLPLYGATK